jgi:hypothetical protein
MVEAEAIRTPPVKVEAHERTCLEPDPLVATAGIVIPRQAAMAELDRGERPGAAFPPCAIFRVSRAGSLAENDNEIASTNGGRLAAVRQQDSPQSAHIDGPVAPLGGSVRAH